MFFFAKLRDLLLHIVIQSVLARVRNPAIISSLL